MYKKLRVTLRRGPLFVPGEARRRRRQGGVEAAGLPLATSPRVAWSGAHTVKGAYNHVSRKRMARSRRGPVRACV